MAYRVIQWATGGVGRGAIDAIATHHEAKDIPTNVAGPAFPGLAFLIDGHRGTTVVVPRTACNEIATLRLQLQRCTDDIDDVNRATHSLFQVEVLGEGQTTTPLKGHFVDQAIRNHAKGRAGEETLALFFHDCPTQQSWRNFSNRSTRRDFHGNRSLTAVRQISIDAILCSVADSAGPFWPHDVSVHERSRIVRNGPEQVNANFSLSERTSLPRPVRRVALSRFYSSFWR